MAAAYSILIIFLAASYPETALPITLRSTHEDVSLKKEVTRSFKNGFEFLKKHQNPDGSWSNPEFPALTGLVLYAFCKKVSNLSLNAPKKMALSIKKVFPITTPQSV
jgi:squalene-hopene/tetraprenyl-beta-curcumene cyclase